MCLCERKGRIHALAVQTTPQNKDPNFQISQKSAPISSNDANTCKNWANFFIRLKIWFDWNRSTWFYRDKKAVGKGNEWTGRFFIVKAIYIFSIVWFRIGLARKNKNFSLDWTIFITCIAFPSGREKFSRKKTHFIQVRHINHVLL